MRVFFIGTIGAILLALPLRAQGRTRLTPPIQPPGRGAGDPQGGSGIPDQSYRRGRVTPRCAWYFPFLSA